MRATKGSKAASAPRLFRNNAHHDTKIPVHTLGRLLDCLVLFDAREYVEADVGVGRRGRRQRRKKDIRLV